MAAGPVREKQFVSYLTVRRTVGILAVVLPVILALVGFAQCMCWVLQPSISDYYDVPRARDLYVGVLSVMAFFLFAYKGYEPRDDRAGDVAAACALLTAFFPYKAGGLDWVVHYVGGTALFLVLAYFALFLFTKSNGTAMTLRKVSRNRVYRICGVTILACVVLSGACLAFLPAGTRAAWSPVFWLETLALWAFGVSWFIKGETLLKDPAPTSAG